MRKIQSQDKNILETYPEEVMILESITIDEVNEAIMKMINVKVPVHDLITRDDDDDER